ncbi:hypothetical protein BH23ACT9_BH23ACT9_29690 [soil metagenome]
MPWRGVLAATALLVLVVGCGGEPPPAGQLPVAAEDPGLIHVHRLAVDPEDPEALYIATHTGLFLSRGGQAAERIGDRFHDLMGFTITADSRFLASGHPDLRDGSLQLTDAPPLLGIVESPDGGATWDSVSLLGETDFHALEARHDRLYGADSTSGRFMVSEDGVEWETRSSPGLQVMAVDPEDPAVIVGAGGATPLRSTDGGRTWSPLDGPTTSLESAAVSAVAWSTELYAGSADGSISASSDAGSSWETRGNVGGGVEALLASGDALFAAAQDVGILRSEDGGRTWVAAVEQS